MHPDSSKTLVPVALALAALMACVGILTTPDAAPTQELALVERTDAAPQAAVSSVDPPLSAPKPPRIDPPAWTSLFDGKSLEGWKSTEFGGEGEVSVDDGAIVLGFGSNMTGVTSTAEIPRINYEVEFLAQRVDGNDFFCGLTFPVKDDYLSLILGGWGGGVCGLSSIDGFDASENQTTQFRVFKKGEWYKIRMRVTEQKIIVWIDGDRIIEQELEDHKLSIRIEVELSCPFGFSTWQTTGALKDIRIRSLAASEQPAGE